MKLVQQAEALGFDSVWSAEAYGSDAITPLAWIAAQTRRSGSAPRIMQMPGRTPAMTAMTAMTLDTLSGGASSSASGRRVRRWSRAGTACPTASRSTRTREYIDIVRQILAREKPVEHHGEHYEIPYTGPGATGLGKPLKSILHGRHDMPIYTPSIGPEGIAPAAEVADGWFPSG